MNIIIDQFHFIGGKEECRIDSIIMQTLSYQCITGTVQNCCGELIKGVCVKAISWDYEPITHTITDCSGKFTLITKETANFFLVFSKIGYAVLQIYDFTECMNVYLEKQCPTCIVSGKVVYDCCKQVEPVRVQLANGGESHCVFSRSDGSFLFTKVPSGKYTLTISGNICRMQSICITVPKGVPIYRLGCIRVQSLDIRCTVHGIITDINNKPIENVLVLLFQYYTGKLVLHTFTNENGLYFFGGVRKGCYYIEAYE